MKNPCKVLPIFLVACGITANAQTLSQLPTAPLDPDFNAVTVPDCGGVNLHIDDAGSLYLVCLTPLVARPSGETMEIVIAKFDANGRTDIRWGTSGIARTTVRKDESCCLPVYSAPARDGGFWIALASGKILKLHPSGMVDAAYGTSAPTSPNLGTSDLYGLVQVIQLPDGGLISLSKRYGRNEAVVRKLLPNGSLGSEQIYPSNRELVDFISWGLNGANLEVLSWPYLNTSASAPLRVSVFSPTGQGPAIADGILPGLSAARYLSPSLAAMPDGKLVLGSFDHIRKWLPDGAPDAGFNLPNFSANSAFGFGYPCIWRAAMPQLSIRIDGELSYYGQLRAGMFGTSCESHITFGVDANGLPQSGASNRIVFGSNSIYRIARSGNYINLITVDGASILIRSLGLGPRADVNIVEYFNRALDHYFMTAHEHEVAFVDKGLAGSGWKRTGEIFGAWSIDTPMPGTAPVCRYYGDASAGPNSHFYSAEAFECDILRRQETAAPIGQRAWRFERDAFRVTAPTDGECPPNLVPVYRVYNRGAERGIDPNHRYVTTRDLYESMQAKGWAGEGVHMCATHN